MNDTTEVKVEKPSKKELLILANQEIEKLKKDLEHQKTYRDMYEKIASGKSSEIEEIHDFLDGLPNVMPKTKSNGYGENKVLTRLLSWIASKV